MKLKENNLLTASLAKLGYVAPILLAVSLGGVSAQALAGVADNNSVFLTKLNESSALKGHYLGAEKATREIFDLNVVEALESDVLVQGNYSTLDAGFDNQLTDEGISQAAILETTAKSLLVGYNFKKLSLNGHDKLVLGVFGGYGLIGQSVSLASVADTSEDTSADEPEVESADEPEVETADEPEVESANNHKQAETTSPEPSEADKVKTYFDTESAGFLGGIYLAYQGNADEPTGLRLGAAVQYSRFTHQFAAGSDHPKDSKDNFPAALIYKTDRIGAKAEMTYTLKLGAIGGYPFLVTKSSQIAVSKDLSDSKKTETSADALISFAGDLQLALNVEDKGLLPFISAGFVKNGAGKDSAGQEISETTDLELGGGLSWKAADNLALKFKLVQSINWKAPASSNKETAVNGYKSRFGLTYLF